MNNPFAYQNDLTNAASEMDGYFRGQAGALAEASKAPLAEKAKALAKRGQDIAKAASDTQSAIELSLGAPMGPVITKTIVQPLYDKFKGTKVGKALEDGAQKIKDRITGTAKNIQDKLRTGEDSLNKVVSRAKGAVDDGIGNARGLADKARQAADDVGDRISSARTGTGTGFDENASEFLKATPTDEQTSRLNSLIDRQASKVTDEQTDRLGKLMDRGSAEAKDDETKGDSGEPDLSAEARAAPKEAVAEEADPELERTLAVAQRNAKTGFAESGRGTDESTYGESKAAQDDIDFVDQMNTETASARETPSIVAKGVKGGEQVRKFADENPSTDTNMDSYNDLISESKGSDGGVGSSKGVRFAEDVKGEDADGAPGRLKPRAAEPEAPSAQEAETPSAQSTKVDDAASSETKAADNAAESEANAGSGDGTAGDGATNLADDAASTVGKAAETGVEDAAEEGGELVAEEAVADSLGPIGWLVGAGLAIGGVVSAIGSSNDDAAAKQQQHLADAVQLPKSPAVNFAGKLVVPVHSAVASE